MVEQRQRQKAGVRKKKNTLHPVPFAVSFASSSGVVAVSFVGRAGWRRDGSQDPRSLDRFWESLRGLRGTVIVVVRKFWTWGGKVLVFRPHSAYGKPSELQPCRPGVGQAAHALRTSCPERPGGRGDGCHSSAHRRGRKRRGFLLLRLSEMIPLLFDARWSTCCWCGGTANENIFGVLFDVRLLFGSLKPRTRIFGVPFYVIQLRTDIRGPVSWPRGAVVDHCRDGGGGGGGGGKKPTACGVPA